MPSNNNKRLLTNTKSKSSKRSKSTYKKSKKPIRYNKREETIRLRCRNKKESGSGVTGDLYSCEYGKGPCRKIKRNEKKHTYVICQPKSKKNLRLKLKCKKSYTDCSR